MLPEHTQEICIIILLLSPRYTRKNKRMGYKGGLLKLWEIMGKIPHIGLSCEYVFTGSNAGRSSDWKHDLENSYSV